MSHISPPGASLEDHHEICLRSEQELWEGLRKGNQDCFKQIYLTHYDSLYHYALKIADDETIARGAIQDIYSTLWYTRDRLSPVYSLKAYLITCLRREVLKKLKRKREKQTVALEFIKRSPEINFSHEEILIERKEELLRRDLITKALNNLSKRQKEVIYLKYYEQLSYQEISRVMGVRYQSVLNNLQKAFKVLRNDAVLKKVISSDLYIWLVAYTLCC